MSLFSKVEMAPRDPILGLNEQFASDANPSKVNLGVGVYNDDNGKLPVLQCVQEVEKSLLNSIRPRGYLPIDGMAAYNKAVQALVFGGAEADIVKSGRIATAQTLGGTGGLKVGADLLHLFHAGAKVLVSNPTWENHRALFGGAGFSVDFYPYYDAANRCIDFRGMIAALEQATAGTIVVLHACCHNPTGYDLEDAQWDQVIATMKERKLVPFLDMAYQGFKNSLKEDGVTVNKFAAAGMDFFVSTSFSKSFSLYGERIGALSVVTRNKDEAARVLSQIKAAVRANYSNPPTHGAALVSNVLASSDLRSQWEKELGEMRDRIKSMRQKLVDGLKAAGIAQDMSFITRQAGMFSYSGLNKEQMVRLRNEFGIYGTDTGRICVAALNTQNIDYVCASIAKVI